MLVVPDLSDGNRARGRVLLLTPLTLLSPAQLWVRSGSSNDAWLPADIHYTNTQDAFQIAFRVTRGNGWNGDVSIDDVFFSDGYCAQQDDDACDFETGMCNWNNDALNDYDWRRGSQGVPTMGTGPTADHTTGQSGYFAYANPNDAFLTTDVAMLDSKRYITGQRTACAFPFVYNVIQADHVAYIIIRNVVLRTRLCPFQNVTYYDCTTVDHDQEWCSTTPEYQGEYINCGERDIVWTTGGTGNGLECAFPFTYNGKTYYTCTYDDEDRPWCSTTPEYRGYWGYCLGKCQLINRLHLKLNTPLSPATFF